MKELYTTLPLEYAHEQDAGADLRSVENKTINPGETVLVMTGLKIALDPNTVGMVCSRSGLALKKSVFVLNSPGIIDAGYRNNIGVILHNAGKEPFEVSEGDRIAQLVITPIVKPFAKVLDEKQFAELESDQRGTGGFGSSGMS